MKVNVLNFIILILVLLVPFAWSLIYTIIENPNCVQINIFIRFNFQLSSAERAMVQDRNINGMEICSGWNLCCNYTGIQIICPYTVCL